VEVPRPLPAVGRSVSDPADPRSAAARSDWSRRVLLLGLGVVRWHPWDAVGAGVSRESAVTLPERDVAKGWQGRLVSDQDGERLGECTGIFADAASGATEWLEVAVEGHRRCLLPALNALEVGGQVRVAFRRAAVLSAPHVGDDTELSKRDDIVLYRHYGVHYSASASPSLLPTGADPDQPKTAELPVTPTGKTDRDTPTPPQPTPSVLTPQPPLVEADTRPHVVQAPTPSRRPTPATPTPVQAVPTSPVSPGPTASSASPQASPAPTPSPGPQAAADDPPVAAPEPMPAPIRPPAPAQVAKPAQPVPVAPKAPVQGIAASRAGESSPGPTVPSQQAQPVSASPGADAPGSGAEPLGPLAGAWASGAPLVALAALAAAVAFGLRARDQRVAAGRTTSAGRRGRAAPSRTRTAPAVRRRTGSTFGTSARKPRVGAAAGPAKHGGGVGRSVRRQLRRLATGGACAAGYLRGARDGRQRYDQLRTQAEQLAQHPQVQAARQAVTDPQAREQALAQTRERYRSSQEQYRSIQRQATELARHPQVRRYRQAVTDPQARQQVFTELRAHPQVQRSRQAVTDPQVRQQVLLELREKTNVAAAALKKRLG